MTAPTTPEQALARDEKMAALFRPVISDLFEKELRRIRQRPLQWRKAFRESEWVDAISEAWITASTVYTPTLQQLTGEPEARQKQELVAIIEDIIGGDAGQAINGYVRDSAQGVIKTSRRRIATVLRRLDNPSDAKRVARAIRRLYKTDFITSRKDTKGHIRGGSQRDARIALHEVLTATAEWEHEAAVEAQRRTGKEYIQVWRNQGDDRVRSSHSGVAPVPLGEKFTLSNGTILRFPRDPAGPARDTYGCRCWTERKRATLATPQEQQERPPINHQFQDSSELKLQNDKARARLAEKLNIDLSELDERAVSNWQEWVDSGEQRIALPQSSLEEMARTDGRYKTQFETNVSGGNLNTDLRAKAEFEMFGYADDLPVSDRPVYGYVVQPGQQNGMTRGYGQIDLVLKSEARSRSTLTFNDSLSPWRGAGVSHLDDIRPNAMPWDEMNHLTPDPKTFPLPVKTDIIDAPLSRFSGPGKQYVETQIHGGVSFADVEAVMFPADSPPSKELLRLLNEWGVDVRIRPNT